MKTRLLIIILVAITSSILVVFAFDSMYLDRLCEDSDGKRTDDICQILIVTTAMKPNSMEFFYYPNPEDIENRDVFQKFLLIRLPESLGGDVDDVSSFRAYSSVSLIDHCLVKYWQDKGRQRMEEPCRGERYRAIDGLLTQNVDPVRITSPMALPHLDLSIDENGFLYVESPIWTLQENGVIGIGRQISLQEIRQGSEILIDSFEKSHPKFPLIPLNFAGNILSTLKLDGNRVITQYFDFSSAVSGMSFAVGLASAQDQQYFLNFAISNSEFWQINDTVIKVIGNTLEKNNDQPERFKTYEIHFIKDGYNFTFGGKNLEFMKRDIIANYFPEHDYDDLFLISSTVKD